VRIRLAVPGDGRVQGRRLRCRPGGVGLGIEEGFQVRGGERIDAEEVGVLGGRLGEVRVEVEGILRNADGLEEGAAELQEDAEAVDVDGLRVVQGLHPDLGQELGDLAVIEKAGEAAEVAPGGGPAPGTSLGQQSSAVGVVEEAVVAVGQRSGLAGLAGGGEGGAAGGGHGGPPVFGHSGVGKGRRSPVNGGSPLSILAARG
jgi:hypothetical protein